MSDIYGVSSGSYSNYRVHFMCSSKAVAEQAASNLRGDGGGWYTDAQVEAFDLYDAPPKKILVYTMQALICDGKVLGGYGRTAEPVLSESTAWEWDTDAQKRPKVRVYKAPITGPTALNITVHGTDKRGVLKAYSDRIVQILAENSTHE